MIVTDWHSPLPAVDRDVHAVPWMCYMPPQTHQSPTRAAKVLNEGGKHASWLRVAPILNCVGEISRHWWRGGGPQSEQIHYRSAVVRFKHTHPELRRRPTHWARSVSDDVASDGVQGGALLPGTRSFKRGGRHTRGLERGADTRRLRKTWV